MFAESHAPGILCKSGKDKTREVSTRTTGRSRRKRELHHALAVIGLVVLEVNATIDQNEGYDATYSSTMPIARLQYSMMFQ
jgi:hypothetical protein